MEENTQKQWPPVRRQPKKKIPKWQRMLRKYWPPIRFGLLILAALLVLWLCIAGIGKLFKGIGKEKVPEVTAPTEYVPTEEEIQQMADELMQEAEFIAAGYDYAKATEMLQDFKYYDQVPALAEAVTRYAELDSKLVSYPNMKEVTHVFFHSLIVDTDRAFDDDFTNGGYNQFMTTIQEFIDMMEEMYARGFVLVSPYDVAYEVTDDLGTRFVYGDIRLPEGKKPFIMSQDDVNYYGYMIGGGDGMNEIPGYADPTGDGFATRIVIGEDGYPTCEYMDAEGKITFGDYDLVPVLERFIQEHPDFSYHGARAVLGVTGYEGVFGYRTKPSYKQALGEEAYNQEIADAKAVVKCLRDHGWIISSHSYGHPAYGQITAEKVEIDSDKFEDTVESVIGEVDIILYPHGSDIAEGEEYTLDNAKFRALYEDGYRYFFNVDGSVYWEQMGTTYYRGGRRNLDGYRMYYNPEMLEDLFDAEAIFDPARPIPVPPI